MRHAQLNSDFLDRGHYCRCSLVYGHGGHGILDCPGFVRDLHRPDDSQPYIYIIFGETRVPADVDGMSQFLLMPGLICDGANLSQNAQRIERLPGGADPCSPGDRTEHLALCRSASSRLQGALRVSERTII